MSGGPEYALRLREVEEENARLRAEHARLATQRDLIAVSAGGCFAEVIENLMVQGDAALRERDAARAESSRLSREVEEARAALLGVVRAAFWAMGWRRFVERHICLGGHPASRRFRRSRERLARVLSGGGDASATGEKR